MARQIENDVSRHLLAMTVINLGLGAVTAVALYFIGMPNPILWGLLGALLNYIPYLGPLLGVGDRGRGGVPHLRRTGRTCCGVVAIFLVITSLEGNLMTPLLLGAPSRT